MSLKLNDKDDREKDSKFFHNFGTRPDTLAAPSVAWKPLQDFEICREPLNITAVLSLEFSKCRPRAFEKFFLAFRAEQELRCYCASLIFDSSFLAQALTQYTIVLKYLGLGMFGSWL